MTTKYRRAIRRPANAGRLNPGTRKSRRFKSGSSRKGRWTVITNFGDVINRSGDFLWYDAPVAQFSYAYYDLSARPLTGDWEVYFTIRYLGSTMGDPPQPETGDIVIAAATAPGCLRSPSTNKPADGTEFIGLNFTDHEISMVEGITGGAIAVGNNIEFPDQKLYWAYMRRDVDLLQCIIYTNANRTSQLGTTSVTRSVVTATDYSYLVAPSFGAGSNNGSLSFELANFDFTY